MVRNLVLTPFIDLSFAHFMFSGEKATELCKLGDSHPLKSDPVHCRQLSSIWADKRTDEAVPEGNHG